MSGSIEVVGVYEVPDASDAVLIEIVAEDPPRAVNVGAFTQEEPGQPDGSWQVPWMERWLHESGQEIASEPFEPPPDHLTTSRLVFFLHHVTPDRPLLTPAGPVALPPKTRLPSRLAGVEYEPVD